MSNQLTAGRRFRILTIVDDCTRETVALIADTSLSGLAGGNRPRSVARDPRQAEDDRRRQRNGAHRQRDPAPGRPVPGRVALHRTGKAHPERVHRVVRWAPARRTPERDVVHHTRPGSRAARSLACRLQRRPSAFAARLAGTGRVRPRLPASRDGAAQPERLRAVSRRSPRPKGQPKPPERTRNRIELEGNVTRSRRRMADADGSGVGISTKATSPTMSVPEPRS